MDRKDFYYRQKVLEDELDGALSGAENAMWNAIVDYNLGKDESNPDEFGSIMWGFAASLVSGQDIQVTSGAAYNALGKRTYTDTSYTTTVSAAGDVAIGGGGTPTGASTDPGNGNERWLSLFIVFDRAVSDLRYDGYNNPVYFERAESFHFYVSAGAIKSIGSLLDADKPAREAGKTLITDIRIQNSGGITVTDVTQSRMEQFFKVTAPASPNKAITRGDIRNALKDLLIFYNNHVGGGADLHAGTDVSFSSSQVWADGTGGVYGAATNVEAAIDGIVQDLAKTTDVDGAKRIGVEALGGAVSTPDQSSPVVIGAGVLLHSVLNAILAGTNGRVFRGGDNGIAGALSPATDGIALGTASKSWDGLIRDLTVKGVLKSDLVPDGDGTRTLGGSGAALVAHLDNTTVYGNLTVDSGGALIVDSGSTFNGTITANVTLNASGGTQNLGVVDIDPNSANVDALTVSARGFDYTQLKSINTKKTIRETASSPVTYYKEDVFGLVDPGRLHYTSDCVIAGATSGAILLSELMLHLPPWRSVNPGGTVSLVPDAVGYEGVTAIGIDIPESADNATLQYGSWGCVLAGDKPAFLFSFYSPSSEGTINSRGVVSFGFDTSDTSNPDVTRDVRIDFDGVTVGEIKAVYYEGSVATTYQLQNGSPLDNILYQGRVVVLDDSTFFFDVRGNGSLIAQNTMNYGGGNLLSSGIRLRPYISISNGSGTGGPTIVMHRISLSSAKMMMTP